MLNNMKNKLFHSVILGITHLRKVLTKRKIQQEARESLKINPMQIGETSKLEILPLYEAISQNNLQSGFGVSYLIRTDKSTILFDLGNNPKALSPSPLEQNMVQIGISLKEIDILVLSHRHPDHVGGMKWWRKKSFSLNGEKQPVIKNLPIYVPVKVTYPGSNPKQLKDPTILAEGIATTGYFTFFESYPLGYIMPRDREQALAVNVAGQGIILIVGCGHMGLEPLLKRAKSTFSQHVIGIVGGLHYGKTKENDLQPDIEVLREIHPQLIALSPHDSYPEVIDVFEKVFPDVYRPVRVGIPINFP
jgi:7,8-dihydropterin-6-yl-methyl-4-(beta-D-ribofuranosyl)aminobenzene 5'-phosphate synthase